MLSIKCFVAARATTSGFSPLGCEIVKKVQPAGTSLRRGLYRSPRNQTVTLSKLLRLKINGDFAPAEFKEMNLPILVDIKIQTRRILGDYLEVY